MNVPFVDLKSQYESIASEVDQAMHGVIANTDFILGEEVDRFEHDFATYCGARHAIGVDSGLAALELALRAYGVGPGDEVITAANTFIATVMAITATGAHPVLVEMDPETYLIDPAAMEAAITPRTAVIMPVHLYGQTADMDTIMSIAERHGLIVIEDACQAHGAWYGDRRAGSIGHAAAFSFYPGKNLGAYGDGGMITTNDAAIDEKLRLLRNYGQTRKYVHDTTGYNHRLDTLQAAILRVKLSRLDDWNATRMTHADTYRDLLKESPAILPQKAAQGNHIYHLFVIRVSERDAVLETLKTHDIQSGIHYPIPIHLQGAYKDLGLGEGAFPVTEAYASQILSLPMFAELTNEQIRHVCDILTSAITDDTVAAS